MTATAAIWDELAEAQSVETHIKRDRWGRYRIPHPDTGKEQSWTRATTLASTLADRYGLEQWAKRNVVLGIGARRDLYTLAASCTEDDKAQLNQIVVQAEEAAKGKAGANAGTAIHRLTERADRGEDVKIADPQIAADIAAYTAAMRAAGIRVARSADGSGAWIERVLVVPEIDVAGTCDRVCLADTWPLPRIGDLKTAKDVLRYGMVEIALQLAIYANATHWFNPTTGQLHPMPTVDQTVALVMHLPVGHATCTLYEVDIAAGWEAVQLAVAVRDWRKRKDLASIVPITGIGSEVREIASSSSQVTPSLTPPNGSETIPIRASVERVLWLRGRVKTLIDAGHGDELAAIWDPTIPTLKQGDLSDTDVDRIVEWCNVIEAEFEIPFGSGDPTKQNPFDGFPNHDTPAAPPAMPSTREEARPWAENGRAILAQFGDPALERAIAECALCADVLMNEDRYRRLEAVVTEAATQGGAVEYAYGPDGPTVVPSAGAADRMALVAGGKSHALHRAKRIAKTLDIPSPRSLAVAAENPLLAAMVAAGMGASETTSNDGKDTQTNV